MEDQGLLTYPKATETAALIAEILRNDRVTKRLMIQKSGEPAGMYKTRPVIDVKKWDKLPDQLVDMVNIPVFTMGFVHPRWCLPDFFLNHQLFF